MSKSTKVFDPEGVELFDLFNIQLGEVDKNGELTGFDGPMLLEMRPVGLKPFAADMTNLQRQKLTRSQRIDKLEAFYQNEFNETHELSAFDWGNGRDEN